MTSRELVISHVTESMVGAFARGHCVDASNLEAFLLVLEEMSDEEYTQFAEEADAEQTGAIS